MSTLYKIIIRLGINITLTKNFANFNKTKSEIIVRITLMKILKTT